MKKFIIGLGMMMALLIGGEANAGYDEYDNYIHTHIGAGVMSCKTMILDIDEYGLEDIYISWMHGYISGFNTFNKLGIEDVWRYGSAVLMQRVRQECEKDITKHVYVAIDSVLVEEINNLK